MKEILEPGRTCQQIFACEEAYVLIDAENYYRAFCEAAMRAKTSIYLSGWQFDTQAVLLRGKHSEKCPLPVRFLDFLNALCERIPKLHIYLLAWDYSSVYALEREWMQSLKLSWKKHERVHFEYWTHPEAGGAHHQKYAVIDETIAFLGGLDICDSRYDCRHHPSQSDDRRDTSGRPYKPFHDIQMGVRGEVVDQVVALFRRFWTQTGARDIPAVEDTPLPEQLALGEICPPNAHLIETTQIALSQTEFAPNSAGIYQISALLTAAIDAAERLIYIESQYFTSRDVLSAFIKRLSDDVRSKLDIVVIMPDGGDTPKEAFVLGDRQRTVRHSLSRLCHEKGHRLRVLCSIDGSDPDQTVSTFIHAKLMIVDDEFLTVGSANLTNRSMLVDTELNLSIQAPANTKVSAQIRDLRASLMSEHAGLLNDEDATQLEESLRKFADIETWIDFIDQNLETPSAKLRALSCEAPGDQAPLLTAVFDPSGALSAENLEGPLQEELGVKDGAFQALVRKAGQRLGVVDID